MNRIKKHPGWGEGPSRDVFMVKIGCVPQRL
jgi:hypothetical protein